MKRREFPGFPYLTRPLPLNPTVDRVRGANGLGAIMIDWSRVTELQSEIGAEDFLEVVDLFLEEVDGVLDRLRQNTDRSQLEQDLHFLKGSALNLGFETFSTLCQDGERAAAAGKAAEVDLAEILECYDTSRDVFVTEMEENLAA